jgi:hypothetical protein
VPAKNVLGGGGVGPAKKRIEDDSIGEEKKVKGRNPPQSSIACSAHTEIASEREASAASASLTGDTLATMV